MITSLKLTQKLETMVRIINYKKRQSEDKEFFVLEVTGGIEMVKSKTTELYYATAKKASITSTFDEETCKGLIGSEFPGSIIKQQCEAYEFTLKETGEMLTLNHRYVYLPEESNNSSQSVASKQSTQSDSVFSKEEELALAD